MERGVKDASLVGFETGGGDLNWARFFLGGGTFSLSSGSSSASPASSVNPGRRAGDVPRASVRLLGVGDFWGDVDDDEPSERKRLRDMGRATRPSSLGWLISIGLSVSSGDGARERVRERVRGGVEGALVMVMESLEGECGIE